ncbi:MAG: aminotransferase class V-fold PLP-dependent enzyme [Patescibacteria group bacterium]
MQSIYLDHAATTPLDKRVLAAMLPFFTQTFGNPSSFHTPGLRAKEALAAARKSCATILNAHADEIVFTSGGTEADNLALMGVTRMATLYSLPSTLSHPHIIASAVEHPAVLEPLAALEKSGAIELTLLPVDKFGRVAPDDLVHALRPDTILVSIMYANNEIGTIEPIAEIGRLLLKWRKTHDTPYPYFHSDACQAAGALALDVEKSHVDLLALNGGKIYGPKGVGCLFVRRGLKLEPLVYGGGQERNLRSGTENVPGIVGFATALELVQAEKERENKRLTVLRDRLIQGLLKIPKTRLNGHPTERLPNNVNVSFMDIEGEAAVLYLDALGIFASTGSACASQTLDPSHVILATGMSYEAAHGSIRFTLGHGTKKTDIDYVLKVMPGIIEKLRHMSPVNLDMKYFR